MNRMTLKIYSNKNLNIAKNYARYNFMFIRVLWSISSDRIMWGARRNIKVVKIGYILCWIWWQTFIEIRKTINKAVEIFWNWQINTWLKSYQFKLSKGLQFRKSSPWFKQLFARYWKLRIKIKYGRILK